MNVNKTSQGWNPLAHAKQELSKASKAVQKLFNDATKPAAANAATLPKKLAVDAGRKKVVKPDAQASQPPAVRSAPQGAPNTQRTSPRATAQRERTDAAAAVRPRVQGNEGRAKDGGKTARKPSTVKQEVYGPVAPTLADAKQRVAAYSKFYEKEAQSKAGVQKAMDWTRQAFNEGYGDDMFKNNGKTMAQINDVDARVKSGMLTKAQGDSLSVTILSKFERERARVTMEQGRNAEFGKGAQAAGRVVTVAGSAIGGTIVAGPAGGIGAAMLAGSAYDAATRLDQGSKRFSAQFDVSNSLGGLAARKIKGENVNGGDLARATAGTGMDALNGAFAGGGMLRSQAAQAAVKLAATKAGTQATLTQLAKAAAVSNMKTTLVQTGATTGAQTLITAGDGSLTHDQKVDKVGKHLTQTGKQLIPNVLFSGAGSFAGVKLQVPNKLADVTAQYGMDVVSNGVQKSLENVIDKKGPGLSAEDWGGVLAQGAGGAVQNIAQRVKGPKVPGQADAGVNPNPTTNNTKTSGVTVKLAPVDPSSIKPASTNVNQAHEGVKPEDTAKGTLQPNKDTGKTTIAGSSQGDGASKPLPDASPTKQGNNDAWSSKFSVPTDADLPMKAAQKEDAYWRSATLDSVNQQVAQGNGIPFETTPGYNFRTYTEEACYNGTLAADRTFAGLPSAALPTAAPSSKPNPWKIDEKTGEKLIDPETGENVRERKPATYEYTYENVDAQGNKTPERRHQDDYRNIEHDIPHAEILWQESKNARTLVDDISSMKPEPGARGVIFGERSDGLGHMMNFRVNANKQVELWDGATNSRASFAGQGFEKLHWTRTDVLKDGAERPLGSPPDAYYSKSEAPKQALSARAQRLFDAAQAERKNTVAGSRPGDGASDDSSIVPRDPKKSGEITIKDPNTGAEMTVGPYGKVTVNNANGPTNITAKQQDRSAIDLPPASTERVSFQRNGTRITIKVADYSVHADVWGQKDPRQVIDVRDFPKDQINDSSDMVDRMASLLSKRAPPEAGWAVKAAAPASTIGFNELGLNVGNYLEVGNLRSAVHDGTVLYNPSAPAGSQYRLNTRADANGDSVLVRPFEVTVGKRQALSPTGVTGVPTMGVSAGVSRSTEIKVSLNGKLDAELLASINSGLNNAFAKQIWHDAGSIGFRHVRQINFALPGTIPREGSYAMPRDWQNLQDRLVPEAIRNDPNKWSTYTAGAVTYGPSMFGIGAKGGVRTERVEVPAPDYRQAIKDTYDPQPAQPGVLARPQSVRPFVFTATDSGGSLVEVMPSNPAEYRNNGERVQSDVRGTLQVAHAKSVRMPGAVLNAINGHAIGDADIPLINTFLNDLRLPGAERRSVDQAIYDITSTMSDGQPLSASSQQIIREAIRQYAR
jgi:hypothetical protein